MWQLGDGTTSSGNIDNDEDIGKVKSKSECLQNCKLKRNENESVNGATWSSNTHKCYCEKGMTSVTTRSGLVSCLFKKAT